MPHRDPWYGIIDPKDETVPVRWVEWRTFETLILHKYQDEPDFTTKMAQLMSFCTPLECNKIFALWLSLSQFPNRDYKSRSYLQNRNSNNNNNNNNNRKGIESISSSSSSSSSSSQILNKLDALHRPINIKLMVCQGDYMSNTTIESTMQGAQNYITNQDDDWYYFLQIFEEGQFHKGPLITYRIDRQAHVSELVWIQRGHCINGTNMLDLFLIFADFFQCKVIYLMDVSEVSLPAINHYSDSDQSSIVSSPQHSSKKETREHRSGKCYTKRRKGVTSAHLSRTPSTISNVSLSHQNSLSRPRSNAITKRKISNKNQTSRKGYLRLIHAVSCKDGKTWYEEHADFKPADIDNWPLVPRQIRANSQNFETITQDGVTYHEQLMKLRKMHICSVIKLLMDQSMEQRVEQLIEYYQMFNYVSNCSHAGRSRGLKQPGIRSLSNKYAHNNYNQGENREEQEDEDEDENENENENENEEEEEEEEKEEKKIKKRKRLEYESTDEKEKEDSTESNYEGTTRSKVERYKKKQQQQSKETSKEDSKYTLNQEEILTLMPSDDIDTPEEMPFDPDKEIKTVHDLFCRVHWCAFHGSQWTRIVSKRHLRLLYDCLLDPEIHISKKNKSCTSGRKYWNALDEIINVRIFYRGHHNIKTHKIGKTDVTQKISQKDVKHTHKHLENLYIKFAEERLQKRDEYWKWVSQINKHSENHIDSNQYENKNINQRQEQEQEQEQNQEKISEHSINPSEELDHSTDENIPQRVLRDRRKKGQKRKRISMEDTPLLPASKRRRNSLHTKVISTSNDTKGRRLRNKRNHELRIANEEAETEDSSDVTHRANGIASYTSFTPKSEREGTPHISASRNVDPRCIEIKNRIIQQTQNNFSRYCNSNRIEMYACQPYSTNNHSFSNVHAPTFTNNNNERKNYKNTLYNLRQSTLRRRRTLTTPQSYNDQEKRLRKRDITTTKG